MRIGSRLSAHLALAPALLIALVAYCGAMGWTIWISFTNSRMLPSSVFVGLRQYNSLFANERWLISVQQHRDLRPACSSLAPWCWASCSPR